MKPKRQKLAPKSKENSLAASIARSYFLQEEKEGKTLKSGVEISREILRRFETDRDLLPRLSDELSDEKVQYVVDESVMILEGGMWTAAHWGALTNFLRGELEEFRETKDDLAKAERKLVMVSQRLEEAMIPQNGEINKTRVMACSMLFGETEMRRDHLKARVTMVMGELTKRISARLEGRLGADELEIRLWAVLGNL